jgi:hypothetical protein
MPSFGIPQGRYGSQGSISNFHTVFGVGSGDTSTPPLLDLSEFPSLTNRAGQGDSMPQPSPMPGKQPYGKCIVCLLLGIGLLFLCFLNAIDTSVCLVYVRKYSKLRYSATSMWFVSVQLNPSYPSEALKVEDVIHFKAVVIGSVYKILKSNCALLGYIVS